MHKLKYLDGLRGLAALLVVINHFVVAFYPALYNGVPDQIHTRNSLELRIAPTPFNLLYNGNFAVCIFFVLSGYVLTYKFFKTGDIHFLKNSAVKRYFRLAVPVLFSVLIVFVFIKIPLFYNRQAADISLSEWWLGSFWNFTPDIWDALKTGLISTLFFHNSSYNTVLWTMTYELYGSFLVFSFAALFGTMRNRWILYLSIALLLYDTIYLGFILGMLLADLQQQESFFDKLFFKKIAIKIVLLLLGLYMASYPTGISPNSINNSIYKYILTDDYNMIVFYHTIGAFLIVLILLCSEHLQRLFSLRFFFILGQFSFALYLTHVIVLGSFTSWLFVKLAPYYSYSISVTISCLISIPLLAFASYLVYKFADQKGIQLANKIHSLFFSSK